MNSNVWIDVRRKPRRKAVWGPKRVLAALFLSFIWWAPTTAAAKPHHAPPQKKHPGVPGSAAKNYKLDKELTDRAGRGNARITTRVIVTLLPGATLPPEFKKYASGRKLDLINGEVLDVPNGVLKQMSAHPSVFRLHFDRPTGTHNYRTAVTVGARAVQDFMGL